jgi:geranylgeranyl pyrophosphate synthase
MRHACLAGGKRLRPALTRLFCESSGGVMADAVRPAVAIEMVHTYSLVHDDLPCMDDDDMRRGQPTVHKRWDEATAVLAGDALLTEAFSVLSAHRKAAQLVSILAAAAGPVGMVGGQCADLGVDLDALQEGQRLDAVMEVHRLKTAALFAAACEMGCVAGGGEGAIHARQYGFELGMLFQATDDVIDVTGTAAGIGKTPGKDADLARPTLVAALGLDGARAQAEAHAAAALSAAAALGLSADDLACRLIAFLTSRTH